MPGGAVSDRYRNAGDTKTRASIRRTASSCGNSSLRKRPYKSRNWLFSAYRKRPAISPVSEIHHRLDVSRFRIYEPLPERGGPVENRLAKRLELGRIGILRGVLPELFEYID